MNLTTSAITTTSAPETVEALETIKTLETNEALEAIEAPETIKALSTSALLSQSRIVLALIFPRRYLALFELVNTQLLEFFFVFFDIIHFDNLRL